MLYASPGQSGSKVSFKSRYQNFIGGQWVAPVKGRIFRERQPGHRQGLLRIPRSLGPNLGGRARRPMLNKIADRMEENLGPRAGRDLGQRQADPRDLAADLPLAIDHFRYFAGASARRKARISEIDHDTVAYHFHEPLGVVGQIIPWNFPILMAVWKLAPALAAGNCVVLKPAEQTPARSWCSWN
jgi:aldehyde dehydrogenase